MSLDHDLGAYAEYHNGVWHPIKNQLSGFNFAVWFGCQLLTGKLNIPDTFQYYVHSQNPVGATNIRSVLDDYLNRYWAEKGGSKPLGGASIYLLPTIGFVGFLNWPLDGVASESNLNAHCLVPPRFQGWWTV